MPAAHSAAEKVSVCALLRSPFAVGRQAVRFMRASMCRSTRQLKAAAALATSQMPTVAASTTPQAPRLGQPGTASSMPMAAQNTISCTTRGLVSALNWRQRDGGKAALTARAAGGETADSDIDATD